MNVLPPFPTLLSGTCRNGKDCPYSHDKVGSSTGATLIVVTWCAYPSNAIAQLLVSAHGVLLSLGVSVSKTPRLTPATHPTHHHNMTSSRHHRRTTVAHASFLLGSERGHSVQVFPCRQLSLWLEVQVRSYKACLHQKERQRPHRIFRTRRTIDTRKRNWRQIRRWKGAGSICMGCCECEWWR